MVKTKFFLLILLPLVNAVSELPVWHMKPLGSHIKPDKVDETFAKNLISPEEFAEKYVLPRKPLIFRDVVKTWPAYKLWTDEYLAKNYGDMEMRLESKKEKASILPKGDICLGRDRLKTFLKDYKKGANKYIVSDLPTPMWREVNVLPPMSCGDFLTNYVEIDLWMNSDMGKKGNGGNSLLHKDAYNTVNCVLNGTKEWKLIELQYNDYVYQSWEGPMDAGYGGFSVINADKVNAKKFPNVGKIPRWQFATINAGDCLHLPSQMWHQVKSYGDTNKAVAFLFSQFQYKKHLNLSSCPKNPGPIPLSDVDVDLQYPGTGLMTMGNSEIHELQEEQLPLLVDRKQGHITKKRTYTLVYMGHANGAKNKKLMIQKAKDLYQYMLDLAGGDKRSVTQEFITNLTRNQIRPTYQWLFPIEPANSYDHEYSVFEPEEISDLIGQIFQKNKGKIEKKELLDLYQERGGTFKFAEDLWTRLAGDELVVTDYSKTLEHALEKYEYHRRNDPEVANVDDDATIITPQGHVSQPKRVRGGYGWEDEEEGENEQNDAGSQPNEEAIEADIVVDEETTPKDEL